MHDEPTKRCGACSQWLPLSAFTRHPKTRDGLLDKCRQCKAAYDRARRADAEVGRRKAAPNRAWATRNPQRDREHKRRSYEANRDRYLAQAAARYRADPSEMKRQVKAWQHANPDRRAEYQRRRRTAKRSYSVGHITEDLLRQKFAYWGNRCWMCGGEATEPDHVKPLSKGGIHCLANIRPACKSCNSSKCNRWPYPVGGAPNWLSTAPKREMCT